ncbi:MAG TPA: hypothetical protein VGO62_03515 [Myxococcota bacterium]|jgi:hypothetical protein
MRQLLGILSALFAIACAAMTAMALHDAIIGDGKTPQGILIGLTIFFGALTVMCGGAAYRTLSSTNARTDGNVANARADDDALEVQILALAATNEGAVTVAEVALHAAVPLDRAERALDALSVRGRADVETTASGATIYRVHGFLSPADKRTARDPLDSP